VRPGFLRSQGRPQKRVRAIGDGQRLGEFETTPFPTGSPLNAMTMGMVLVARFAAHDAGPNAIITLTLLATNSLASAGSRFNCPSAQR